jgi:hypothetical protein
METSLKYKIFGNFIFVCMKINKVCTHIVFLLQVLILSLQVVFGTIAMHSHPHIYNCIDVALQSQIIYSIFTWGLSYADTSEDYGHPFNITKIKAIAFKRMVSQCPNT